MVKEFKYLGTTLSPSGSLFLAKEKLRKQANKAYFPVISALHKIDFDTVRCLKLFDSLIKPILTYNCEFWSQLTKSKIEAIQSKKISLEESYFDAPAEKLHLLFCRNVLGVSNKTSSLATLGELGRYPAMLNCLYVQRVKYWHHIKTAYSKDSLVYEVISYMENNDEQEQYKWLSTVKFILELCELDYVWKDSDKIENSNLITKCFNSLVERYINFWQDRISNDYYVHTFVNIFTLLKFCCWGYFRSTLWTWVDALLPVCMRGSFLLLSGLHPGCMLWYEGCLSQHSK